MKDKEVNVSRRALLKGTASGIAVVSLSSILPSLSAHAGDMPKVSESDPAAQALSYKHDASKVDKDKHPSRLSKPGVTQVCDNCNLYTGDAKAEWGGCRIFPGKLVNGKGWCTAWVAK